MLSIHDIRTSLETILPAERILTASIERIAYATDAGCYRLVPQAIVKPRTADDVQQLFAWSVREGVPLTFRAGATSLSGQAVGEGVIVDVSRGWDALTIGEAGKTVTVQCGMTGHHVNQHLRAFGRKLGPDPASINAALVGGIVANNASGMCCGVMQNSYHTIDSMRLVLPVDNACTGTFGLALDTSNIDAANATLLRCAPNVVRGILDLKHLVESQPDLVATIRRKYQIKNTIGYSLNAFLDFQTAAEIIRHVMIGSEGTLGFIADVTFRTVPDHPLKYTGLLFFETVPTACASIAALRDSGAAALELMDYACLHAMREQYGAPKDIIAQLPSSACALLVEYQSSNHEEFQHLQHLSAQVISSLPVMYVVPFTDDYKQQAKLWKLRKGILPVVSAARRSGTTVITEDIAFPIEHLAPAIAGLQELFVKHRYPDGVIFGHAKDGNLHFNIAQSFNTEADVRQFEAFLDDLAVLVVDRYHGSLKAEHGTGRNMAPFVEKEWGSAAYRVMRKLKELLDPHGILNPGVIINDDPQAHLKNLKPIPQVEEEVDACLECGWCENKCPSQGLTLTPRQRIVVRREITRLQDSTSDADTTLRKELVEQYNYHGLETCATDGMCATVCPVGINTGDLVKILREEQHSPTARAIAVKMSKRFSAVEGALRVGLQMGHWVSNLGGAPLIRAATKLVASIVGERLPLWNERLGAVSAASSASRSTSSSADAVYFPACVSRLMGRPHSKQRSVIDTMLLVAERAGVRLWMPEHCEGYCCGTPFSSKGFSQASKVVLQSTIERLWEWSDGGRIPVVTEASSCSYKFRTCHNELDPLMQQRLQAMTILDSIEFTHNVLLPKLRAAGRLRRIDAAVMVHPVCSVVKLGIDELLHSVAESCAHEAIVPLHAGCCAFAGDRGMIAPELTKNATALEAREVCQRQYDGYYSSNPMCEAGMSTAVGREYVSYLYLVEEASRDRHDG
jgi:D-lactate dehydrogenase